MKKITSKRFGNFKIILYFCTSFTKRENMSLNNNFKNAARTNALNCFIKAMKKHGFYGSFVEAAYRLLKSENNNDTQMRHQCLDLLKKGGNVMPLPYFSKTLFLDTLLGLMEDKIEANFRSMFRRNNGTTEEYEYLVHCVNTLIQTFYESYIYKKHNGKGPRMEELGLMIFQKAGRLTFGDSFQVEKPQPSTTQIDLRTLTEVEKLEAEKIMQNVLKNGGDKKIAIDIASMIISQKRQVAANGMDMHEPTWYLNTNEPLNVRFTQEDEQWLDLDEEIEETDYDLEDEDYVW